MTKVNRKLIICILIILIIAIIALLINNVNKIFDRDIVFTLKGEKEIVVYYNELYTEPGVIATRKDKDISNQVVINGFVNIEKIGVYIINYSLKDEKNNTKTLTRTVEVKYKDGLELIGPIDTYLLINGEYKEEGCKAYYNNQDIKDEVKIESDVDTSREGKYNVIYTYGTLSATRNVYVSNFDDFFNINYDNNPTNKDVVLNINIDKSKISKYLLPNKEEKQDNDNYIVSDNGELEFLIYDLYENSYTKKIQISNIDKIPLTLSCQAKVSGNKTEINVTSNKNNIQYYYNNTESNSSTYTFNQRMNSIKVKAIDQAGNSIEKNCSISYYSPKLEVHFIVNGYTDDAILIRTDDKTIFIDGGRYEGKDRVLAYLKDLGIIKIDVLIGSHVQNNHIASQAAILDAYPVDTIYYPDDIKTCNTRNSCSSADQKYIVDALNHHKKTPIIINTTKFIEIGEMKLYFIGPPQITTKINNNSFIFVLKFRNNSFMFTGDAGLPLNDINTLTKKVKSLGITLDVDVLKYPHHGYNNITEEMLEAMSPKYVIFTNYAAPGNPSSNNRNNILSVGGVIYRQSDSLNILVTSDGNKINVSLNVKASTYKRNW